MNNLTATALGAAYGELGVSETAADLPWQMTVVNVPVLIGYAAVIRWLARRQGIETRTAPVEPPPLPGEQLRWTTAPSSAASPALQRPAQGPGEVVGG